MKEIEGDNIYESERCGWRYEYHEENDT